VSKPFTDIDSAGLEALIARVSEAKENQLALSPEDCQLLLDALVTLSSMQDRLANHDVTIHKLRKLLGIEKSTESQSNITGKASKGSKAARQKPRKALPKATQVKPTVVMHSITDLAKGDDCPQCEIGKVYKAPPGNLLRISGHSPFVPEQHVMERLRCNACGAYYTATLPEAVLADGEIGQKYGYSARALMSIHKYFAGLPYYRQGSLQQLLGVSISASTSCDQTEFVADAIYPVYQYLLSLAGNAKHYYMDDTTHRILDAKPIEKKVRNSDKTQMRSGVYASGIIATLEDNHDVVLFDTSIGHAGEFIDVILTHRNENTPIPIIMSDALGSNKPTVCAAIDALCNSHARRQFADVISHFPKEVEHILQRYEAIWVNEHETVEQSLNPAQRLAYHQQHSLPVMAEIKQWGETKLQSEEVEHNSALGKAIRYFIKHYEGLTCFCRIENAKLDNNAVEAILKIVVRDRKNAMFHRNQTGATIGDIVTSLIATASEAQINVFEYFILLQQEKEAVKANPAKFLPWNYTANK
jgi:hypothetical protein